jgi:glycerate dehydrogenase
VAAGDTASNRSGAHASVVLDGYTLNPGDLSWDALRPIGALTIYERSAPGEVVERARGASILITNKVVLDAPRLEQLPDLRYIGVSATGTNIVDVEAARRRNVLVTNVPDYGAASVAEHTFALLLEAVKNLATHARAVAEGAWPRSPDFSFNVAPVSELADKTLGIVGLGAIGTRVAEIALAFRMRVIAAVRSDTPGQKRRELPGVEPRALDAVFESADVLSLHCPLTPVTRSLVDARRLALMKPTALLINTARGGLVDEAALARALREQRIRGACLDVLSQEPPAADNPLLSSPNCWITPHMAWASVESRRRLLNATIDNVRAFAAGSPVNVVG